MTATVTRGGTAAWQSAPAQRPVRRRLGLPRASTTPGNQRDIAAATADLKAVTAASARATGLPLAAIRADQAVFAGSAAAGSDAWGLSRRLAEYR